MTETGPKLHPEIRVGAEKLTRRLIVIEGRSGIQLKSFDPDIVANQAKFGRGEDDTASMVRAHENTIYQDRYTFVLGVQTETRDTLEQVLPDGSTKRFVEETPRIVNHWVGQRVRILTRDEAAKTPYAGRSALDWATIAAGVRPEMVVRAGNGYFYPAGKDDVVVAPVPIRPR